MPLGPSGGENAGLTMVDLTIGSRVRKSPFFAATVEAGATAFTIYNHMFMPTSYGDPEREYELVTRAAALWDVAAHRPVDWRCCGTGLRAARTRTERGRRRIDYRRCR